MQNIYQYLEISKTNIDDDSIDSATLEFKVPLDWLVINSYAKENVVVFRHNDGWKELETVYEFSDDSYAYFNATSPGFSFFSIGYLEPVVKEDIASVNDGSIGSTQDDMAPSPEKIEAAEPESSAINDDVMDDVKGSSNMYLVVIVLLVAAAIIGYFFIKNRKQH